VINLSAKRLLARVILFHSRVTQKVLIQLNLSSIWAGTYLPCIFLRASCFIEETCVKKGALPLVFISIKCDNDDAKVTGYKNAKKMYFAK
jgi:hypothetical protein